MISEADLRTSEIFKHTICGPVTAFLEYYVSSPLYDLKCEDHVWNKTHTTHTASVLLPKIKVAQGGGGKAEIQMIVSPL